MSSADRRADALVVVVFPGLLATGLSLAGLTGRSLGFDEGATVAITAQHGHALWRAIARDGGNMSGYYLLLHVLQGWFGDSPWVLRLPSAVLAALTPACVGAIGLSLWSDRRCAGLAAVLSAVSVTLVYWGQTARGYAGMLGFGCLGMLCFVRLVGAVGDGRPWGRWALGYVVAMTLACYCGFIVVLLAGVQVVMLLGRRRALWRFAGGCLVALALLCVPIAVLAVRRGSGQLFWVPPPSGQVDTQVLQALTSAGFQSTFHPVFTTRLGVILTVAVVLGLLALLLRDREWGAGLVLAWAILPVAVLFVDSVVSQPVFLPRNLLMSVPAVALVLARVLADRRLPRWLAVAATAVFLLVRAAPVVAAVDVSPEPWSTVSARVLSAARPGDCITFYPEDARNAFHWYASRAGALGRAPRSVLPAVAWSQTRPFVELYPTLSVQRVDALRGGCRRMWFVSSHEGQPSGPAESVRHRRRWYTLRARLERAFGDGPVRTYGWASPIHVQLLPGRHAAR